MEIDYTLTAASLRPAVQLLFDLSAQKIISLEKSGGPPANEGSPVFTVNGRWHSRGWTEWTQGFQFGSALLQFDATDERVFLEMGRRHTVERMASHVSHIGVHDHGFNNVSTYGNLWRLAREGKFEATDHERHFYELALKTSGAIQAARWTQISPDHGFIYSFNGPHSLFIDTMRSLRSLAIAHQLGHALMGECDEKISLLDRLCRHGHTTATYNIYYGSGRDSYDVAGRIAHESIFNINDGRYRCPSSQQGYSPFTTWSRGLAWAILGFAEELEFLSTCDAPSATVDAFERAALVTANYYIQESCADGIPMWDFGAPNLRDLGDYKKSPADPHNPWEPVDSSAASIAAQGLMRLSDYLETRNRPDPRYKAAGLTVARALFSAPYLSENSDHQGLILHSVYHRPNGWDHIHRGQRIPNGESSMWGDYHARELALLIWRECHRQKLFFFKHE